MVLNLLRTMRSPTSGPRIISSLWPDRNQAAQREVSGGLESEALLALPPELHLLFPHLPQVGGKFSSTKLVPGSRKVGDCCYKPFLILPTAGTVCVGVCVEREKESSK